MPARSRRLVPPLAALIPTIALACYSGSAVGFRNRGIHKVWVERAELGGIDDQAGFVPPGFLGPGGGGKSSVLLRAKRHILNSVATICWRHADLEREPLRCAAVQLTKKCLSGGYRPMRDDLLFEIRDQTLAVGVVFASRSGWGDPIWSSCTVTYSGHQW